MSFFKNLFGRKESAEAVAEAPAECPHSVLAPRWDNVQDMGIQDKATGYKCEACGESFSPEDGRAIIAARG